MTDRLYLRHSTDKQTNARQKHALAPLLAAGAPLYEDPATSSRIRSLDRPGFKQLLEEATVGDTIRIADAARLFRSVGDIIALRPKLIGRGLHLRVESGLLSGIDLASDDPGTKMMVSVLAAVLEFQRDMISENTREGVAAAAASGKTLGRPTALREDQATTVVEAYGNGASVKGLARQYGVSPRTIRRVLDDAGARELPDLDEHEDGDLSGEDVVEDQAVVLDPPLTLDVPGLLAEQLHGTEHQAVREALAAGQTIRRGQGYSVRVTAPLTVHQAVLDLCAGFAADGAAPAGRKAYRVYSERISSASASA